MKIGVPKEIKSQEHRIGLTPDSVKILTSNGNKVLVEKSGGFEAEKEARLGAGKRLHGELIKYAQRTTTRSERTQSG